MKSTMGIGAVVLGLSLTWGMGAARGSVITALAGDRDSFGTGKPDGSTVSVNEILVPGGEDGPFDQWGLLVHSWTHGFAVPVGESIVGASLKIVTLDMEDNGEGDGLGGGPFDDLLFLDGVEFPGAFDDVFTGVANADTQITPNTSIFDLSLFLASLTDGSLDVVVRANGGTRTDSISIDYAELTVVTRPRTPAPEPGANALLILALAVAAFALSRHPAN